MAILTAWFKPDVALDEPVALSCSGFLAIVSKRESKKPRNRKPEETP
jgi:hypothetical protein